MKQLFQYCVVLHKYEESTTAKTYKDTEIVIEPKCILAKS